MSTQLGALFLLGALAGTAGDTTILEDYREAWNVARAEHRPVLVILNPGPASSQDSVDLDMLRRSGHRRKLLERYVVAVVDTSSDYGQAVHRVFKSPKLPYVAVLDREQKWQLCRTSDPLSPEDWNLLLEKHRSGTRPLQKAAAACFT